jgi:hypothetical protein
MIDNSEIIKETLDNLIDLKEKDPTLFFQAYKSLPFNIYSEIERLSVSKSSLYKDLCKKARDVANSFHKSIK